MAPATLATSRRSSLGEQTSQVLHPEGQLVALQLDQTPLDTKCGDIAADLGVDPTPHLDALGDGCDVTDLDLVADLQHGEVVSFLNQTSTVTRQGRQCLVGASQ